MPAWAHLVAVVPFVVLGIFKEFRYVRAAKVDQDDFTISMSQLLMEDVVKFRQGVSLWPRFALSKCEIAEMSTHGVALAAVMVMHRDVFFRDRVAIDLTRSAASRLLAPAITRLTVPGVMLMSLLTGTFMQFVLTVDKEDREEDTAYFRSEVAGFGALASRLASHPSVGETDANMLKALLQLIRLAYGGLIQATMQGTAIMAHGQGLEGQPALAISLFVTVALGLKKSAEFIPQVGGAGKNLCAQPNWPLFILASTFFLVKAFAAFCFLWAGWRVLRASSCDSLLWDYRVGCKPAPLDNVTSLPEELLQI